MLSLPGLPAVPGSPPDSPDSQPFSALEPRCDKFPENVWPDVKHWRHSLDIPKPEFHRYLGNRLESFYTLTGADGVIFDSHVPDAFFSSSLQFFLLYCKRAVDLQNASVSSEEINQAIEFCDNYAENIGLMHLSLKDSSSEKLIGFNGGLAYWRGPDLLYDPDRIIDEDGRIRCSESFSGSYAERGVWEALKLLENSDVGTIEYFGSNPDVYKFDIVIEPYLEIIRNHPDKHILVFGRSKDIYKYQDYASDYEWQRYLYGSYLLAKTPKSLFKYLATFTNVPVPSPGMERTKVGRSGGMDFYSDWELDFGEPLGPYSEENGLLARRFTNGLVLVSPHQHSRCDPRVPQTFTLPGPMFDSEKRRLEMPEELEVILQPGEARFFFYAEPDVPEVVTMDFEYFLTPDLAEAGWAPAGRWTEIGLEEIAGKANKFLRIDAIPESAFPEFSGSTEPPEPRLFWEHDVLLDAARSHPDFIRPDLSMLLRSEDPDLKLFLMAEVDDNEVNDKLGSFNYLIVELSPGKSVEVQSDSLLKLFPLCNSDTLECTWDMAYRAREDRPTPYLHHTVEWPGDSEWHTLQIHGDEIFDRTGRFTFRRWSHMRVIGSTDIDDIIIRKTNGVIGSNQANLLIFND